MNDVTEFFRLALSHFIEGKRGVQSRIAAISDVEPAYFNQILKGKKPGSDEARRKIASALGFPGRQYEDFLDIGRDILAGRKPREQEPAYLNLSAEPDPDAHEFLRIKFSDQMKLAAGGGGAIPVTEDEECSKIIVHGPSIGRRNAKYLQAFRVGGDSMEPLIAENGIVLADLRQNSVTQLNNKHIYVICWDLDYGECAVKYVSWAEKDRLLAIESENKFYETIYRKPKEVLVIGRVIWSWREH